MKPKFSILSIQDINNMVAELKREVDCVVFHCSAEPEYRDTTAETIDEWHKREKAKGGRGYIEIGYNIVVELDGTMKMGRNWERIPAHVYGHNRTTLGVLYIGGTEKDDISKAKDTRTEMQKIALLEIAQEMKDAFCKHHNIDVDFKGHRDFSPDLDGDGSIEPFEWMKDCPSFDVAEEIVSKLK